MICPSCEGRMIYEPATKHYTCQSCGLSLTYAEILEEREKKRAESEEERVRRERREYLKWWLSSKEEKKKK